MTLGIHQKPIVCTIFALTYLGIAVGHIPLLKLNRVGIALLGAIAMMVCAGSSAADTAGWVNWPVIFLLFGLFVLSAQLRLSGFYDWVARLMAEHLGAPAQVLAVVMVVAAGLSAFLNNDIVCYVFTPVVAATLIGRKLNPAPFLIALALASNLGAAITLIGNAQGMLIGEVAHLSFFKYLIWSFPPVAGTLAVAYLLVFRSLRRQSPAGFAAVGGDPADQPRPFDRRHALKGLVIFGAVVALFFTRIPKELVVLVAAGIHLASPKFRTEDLLALVDWPILVLFMSLFVVTGAFAATGYPEQMVGWLTGIGFSPARLGNEAVLTAGMTALMNNAPAVMLLLKLVPVAQPSAAYVMALANSIGGNVVLTASVANLIVVQQARRQGIVITFGEFARLGVPVTLAGLAVLSAWAALVG
jgi:Na+/H+ antiporter NhaD/arsenite permease-like protein